MSFYSLGSHRSQAVPERRVVQTHFWNHARPSECLKVSSGFFQVNCRELISVSEKVCALMFVNPLLMWKAAVVLSKDCLSGEFPLPLGSGLFQELGSKGGDFFPKVRPLELGFFLQNQVSRVRFFRKLDLKGGEFPS